MPRHTRSNKGKGVKPSNLISSTPKQSTVKNPNLVLKEVGKLRERTGKFYVTQWKKNSNHTLFDFLILVGFCRIGQVNVGSSIITPPLAKDLQVPKVTIFGNSQLMNLLIGGECVAIYEGTQEDITYCHDKYSRWEALCSCSSMSIEDHAIVDWSCGKLNEFCEVWMNPMIGIFANV